MLSELNQFDECIESLKSLYVRSAKDKRDFISQELEKLLRAVDFDSSSCEIADVTTFPNRESLIKDVSLLKEDAMLVLLQINQLQSVSELYGIKFAKEIVVHKAKQICEIMPRTEVTIYNLNTHEFALLISKQQLFDKYLSILKYSLLDNQDKDYYADGEHQIVVTDFTAGVSYGKEHIFSHADIALQKAIAEKISYKIYSNNKTMDNAKKSVFERLKVYKDALNNDNITPYFQPIVDSKDGSIIKYEALARIITDSGEIISPADFLDSAKDDKTFEFFTRQMLQKVFNIYAKTATHITANITYENISSLSTMSYIKNRLDKYGGDHLTFEIVESEEIKDYKVVEEFILLVKEYGCKVSIDDFGSGYSNFTNLIKLNIDYIKIDGTLVEKINIDKKVFNMVKGLLMFAKGANIKTIAEFVSSKEIADTIKKLEIDYAQGYYYGEPKSAENYGLV